MQGLIEQVRFDPQHPVLFHITEGMHKHIFHHRQQEGSHHPQIQQRLLRLDNSFNLPSKELRLDLDVIADLMQLLAKSGVCLDRLQGILQHLGDGVDQ
ncbi:hypothetical protein D3C81_1901030 [compost metagenome]